MGPEGFPGTKPARECSTPINSQDAGQVPLRELPRSRHALAFGTMVSGDVQATFACAAPMRGNATRSATSARNALAGNGGETT